MHYQNSDSLISDFFSTHMFFFFDCSVAIGGNVASDVNAPVAPPVAPPVSPSLSGIFYFISCIFSCVFSTSCDLICVYSTTATSTTPQFVITVTGLSDPLCFNLPLTSGKEYKLLDAARGSSGEKKKVFLFI